MKTSKNFRRISLLLITALLSTLIFGFSYYTVSKKCVADEKVSFRHVENEESKLPAETLIGTAWENLVIKKDGMNDIQVSTTTYAAGSRNHWHAHTLGQIIIVTEGEGYYQTKGSPRQLLKKGDAVRTLPGFIHWHGATPDSKFSFISIEKKMNDYEVNYFEPVSDTEYLGMTSEIIARKVE